MSDQSNIERNHGTFVEGIRAGASRGLRDDQDEAVEEFALRLSEEFPHDVTIRFNSNRKGGGAWLKDGKRNAQVGLGAELKAPESHKEEVQAALDAGETLSDIERDYETEDMNLVYTVHLVPPAVDESHCNRESGIDDVPYTHRPFDSLEDAWQWFVGVVDRDGVRGPPWE